LGVPDGAATHQLHSSCGLRNSLLETLEVDVDSGTITVVEFQVVVGQLGEDTIISSPFYRLYEMGHSPILLLGNLQWSTWPFLLLEALGLVLPHLPLLKTLNHQLGSIRNSKVIMQQSLELEILSSSVGNV
jgi:hypothetical protein